VSSQVTVGAAMRSLLGRVTTPLLPDDYLKLINPLWSARELRGRIVEVRPETRDSATLVIKPGWGFGFDYQPGQYIGIGLLIGAGLYAACELILMVLGIYRVDGLNPLSFMIPAIAMAVSSSVYEELLFREAVARGLDARGAARARTVRRARPASACPRWRSCRSSAVSLHQSTMHDVDQRNRRFLS
jgi:membrane protease YdiL (CAAX protease family)